jgi:hypothetical protein
MDQPSLAAHIEQDLKLHANRRNGLLGLKIAKEKAN